MSTSPVIHALIAKRAEVSGIIADLEERTRQARADLVHIDATLRLFDPDTDPDQIAAKKPARRQRWFGNGEISRRIREALRDATEPVAAEAIVRAAMADKGLDPEDKAIRQELNRSFLWALHRLHVTGEVQKVGHGLGARWGFSIA